MSITPSKLSLEMVADQILALIGHDAAVHAGALPPNVARLLSVLRNHAVLRGTEPVSDRSRMQDLKRRDASNSPLRPERQRTTVPSPRGSGAGPDEEVVVRKSSGPMYGWRGWRLLEQDGRPLLQSLHAPDLWETPVFSADRPLAAGGGGRSTGVHAYATPGQMHRLARGPAIVYGQISVYGRVCVHELGYRAEHARIDRLYLRACGRHAVHMPTNLEILAAAAALPLARDSRYCGCDALSPDEWLTYRELEVLAARLGDVYQCEVIVDAERARGYDRCRGRRDTISSRRG